MKNVSKELKDYAFYHPAFIRKAIRVIGYGSSDNLSMAILKNMSDSEIAKLPPETDQLFYECLDNGATFKNEYAMMARLKAGKNEMEGKEEVKNKNSDFETFKPIVSADEYRSQSPSASVGVKDSEPGWTNCKLVAEKMVYRHLYESLDTNFKRTDVTDEVTGKYEYIVGNVGAGEYLKVLEEDKSEYKNIEEGVHKQSTFNIADSKDKALQYLDEYLDEGIAVVVGVDHTFNRNLNEDPKTTSKNTFGYNDGTTDHFIVVVGKGLTKDGKKYYQFYDPGTSHKNNAIREENKLIEAGSNHFTAQQPYNFNKNKKYHLTMVLLFKKDKSKFGDDVKSNIDFREKLYNQFRNKTGDFSN